MPRAKTINGEPAKWFNTPFEESLFKEVTTAAKAREQPVSEYVRHAVRLRLNLDGPGKERDDETPQGMSALNAIADAADPAPTLPGQDTDEAYFRGVHDACDRIRKTAKLRVKMAHGETMGEHLARSIEDILKHNKEV